MLTKKISKKFKGPQQLAKDWL